MRCGYYRSVNAQAEAEAKRTDIQLHFKAYDDTVLAGDQPMISVLLQLAYEAAQRLVEAAETDPVLQARAKQLAKDLDTWRRHEAEAGVVSEDLLRDVLQPWPG